MVTLVEAMLRGSDLNRLAELRVANTVEEAVAVATDEGPWDVLLLDLQLPDSDGLDGLDSLVLHAPDAATVVVTSETGVDIGRQSLRRGATEFVSKPDLTVDGLGRSIVYAIERKAFEIELRQRGDTDTLTGLANRRSLEAFHRRCAASAARSGVEVLVAVADVDRFKVVNDSHGHVTGDRVLRSVADALQGAVRESDLVARTGGDEFVICALGIPENSIEGLVDRLLAVASRPVTSDGSPEVTLSIGTAVGAGTDSLEALLERADREMYERKRSR